VSSPTRPNRRGVTVPFRVLPGSEVASLSGYPLPVRPRRSQNAQPFRYSFIRPHPRTRLLGRSSHGVRSSFTVFPEISAPGLSTEGTSLGVPSPLQRSWEERVHVPLRLPASGSLVVPGGSPTSPTLPATVPLAGFPNLSAAFFLSPPSRHFQAGGVHGVSPFRDLFLPRSLDDSSSPTCPLDVPPIELALIPVLGGDARGHSDQCLGHSGRNL
jgi:hypothetical protein